MRKEFPRESSAASNQIKEKKGEEEEEKFVP
jgi:hypothetical protein